MAGSSDFADQPGHVSRRISQSVHVLGAGWISKIRNGKFPDQFHRTAGVITSRRIIVRVCRAVTVSV
jgi:hypothetical protein